MTDQELAEAINAYLDKIKNATRRELRQKHNVSACRLERLEKEGLITLPQPLSRSQAATLNRRRHNLGANWYINRPAPWQLQGRKS